MGSCLTWPAAPGNPQHPLAVGGAPPILLLNTRHDPSTGYPGWRHVAGQIPGTVLLTYGGWGHVAYPRSACTTSTVDRYLTDLVLPAAGTRCPAVPPG